MNHPCKGGCGVLTPKLYCEACRERKPVASGGVGGKRVRATSATPLSGATTTKHAPRLEGLDRLTLILYGAPRTKKTHNQVHRYGGRLKVVPSKQWMKWRDKVKESGDVKPWMRLRDQPYNCRALFYRDADRGDATGLYQGLADVLQEAGVVSDDKWLVSWDGSQLLVDKTRPRIEIALTPIHETGDER